MDRRVQEEVYQESTSNARKDLDDELKNIKGLCQTNHLRFLRGLTSRLPTGSNILEVGTYVGATSLALLQGARQSGCKLTSIDLYTGFPDAKITTRKSDQCIHWEYLEWQNNLINYSDLVTTYQGCSIPILKELVGKGKKYDLIFLDTDHGPESLSELTLISCLASENCLFVLDDVIDYNHDMTLAWLTSLKYHFAFPRFFDSRYTLARPKTTSMPINFKTAYASVFKEISEMADFLEDNINKGCKFSTSKIESGAEGFTINIH